MNFPKVLVVELQGINGVTADDEGPFTPDVGSMKIRISIFPHNYYKKLVLRLGCHSDTKHERRNQMFKKVTTVTALATTILVGGSFASDVSAESKYYQNQPVNVMKDFSFNKEEINQWIQQYMNHETQQPTAEQAEESKASTQEEQVKQPESNQETPAQETTEQPQAQQPTQQTQQQPTTNEQTNTEQASGVISEFEKQVVELTNQERQAQGLEPLQISEDLSEVAGKKSEDMAQNGYFSHNSPTYGSPFDMMDQFGIDYRTAGENIAKGQTTPAQVVEGWMNSEGHRQNIMNPDFTHIGVGYVEDGHVWTQQFIGK